MTPSHLFRLAAVIVICAAAVLARAADWVVPAFNGAAIGFGNYSSIACFAAKHKVYVGILTDSIQRKGLLVYDTDGSGQITGTGRQYLSHPSPEPAGKITWVSSMLVDTRHSKLFLGMSPQDSAMTDPLVMWNLDASGEPTGSPTAYATGHPYNTVDAIALHPTLNRLYTVGWGGAGVYIRNLDSNGVPTGAPVTIAAGGYGKYSIGIRSNGGKIYLGTYPGVLEVFDLDAGGNKSGSVRTYTATNYPAWYLHMSVNDRGVYYQTSDNTLARWALTGGEPTGAPIVDAGRTVLALGARPGNTLAAAEPVTFTDAIDGTTKTGGMRVREYTLNADGSPGAILNDTGASALDGLTSYNGIMNAQPDPVVAVSSLSGFAGNRYGNLSVRTILLSATATGSYTPHFTSTAMSSYGAYLRFAYSSRYGKVYSADGNNINIYNLATGAMEANVACAGSTQVMAADDGNGDGYLYVALSNGNVDRRALDANGLPAADADVIVTGAGSIGAMAVNPAGAGRPVYLACAGGAAGAITGSNLVRLPGSSYFHDLAVDPVKGRAYAGSAYNANSNLWVWRLKADGSYLSGPTTFADGIPLYGTLRGSVGGVALNAALGKLYLSISPETGQGAGTSWITTYTLDAAGDPAASTAVPGGNSKGSSGPIALSTDGRKLYEGGWGDATLYLQPLDAGGAPAGSPVAYAIGQYGLAGQIVPAGNRLLTGTYPSVLEAVTLNADGTGALAPTGTLDVKSQSIAYGQLVPGVATGWTSLNTALKGWSGTALGVLSLTGATLTQASVRFDFSLDGGATVLTSGTANLDGNKAEIFLPAYGVSAARLANLAAWIRTSADFYNWCLSLVPPDAGANRPQRFLVANTLFANESNPDSTALAYQMLNAMGHNTIGGWGGARPATLHDRAVASGLTRFKWAVYNPPSYFDFYPEYFTPGYQENWADGFAAQIANTLGATPSETELFHMADEPGWYFPTVLNEVNDAAHSERLAVFHAYLQSKGCTPATFGETSWDTVLATGQSAATTLAKKKLYYWSCRFYADSNAKAFAASNAALLARLNPKLKVTTNLNNWPGRYYIPSPGAAIANNPIVGPDSAMGMPDWHELGRCNGVSCIWTEDWFSDQSAQGWSLYGDLLRCAAREGAGLEYGGYVVGQPLGAFPDGSGGPYKLMALIGHGAKAVDAYVFGPNEIFGDGWSPSTRAYKPYTDALHLLGQCENVLYPGRPRNGTVALLLSKASQPWDDDAGNKQYMYELYGEHYALTHQQYPVDIIDDTDIENGALASYGYKTLYVTAPNLSATAQTAVKNWVNAGGTLALFPGTCRFDEYNEPVSILTAIMGADWPATVTRDNASGLGFRSPRTNITVTDAATLGAAADTTPAQTAPLTVTTATALATMSGGAAVTRQSYGAGIIFAYGYYPGVTYTSLLNGLDATRLPLDWRAETRNILTAPARAGAIAAPRFVTVNADLVEAALLEDATAGIGITLLNWSGSPLGSATVTIDKATMPAAVRNAIATAAAKGRLQVSSVRQGPLTAVDHAGSIEVSLPLATVDVLMLAPAPNAPPTVKLTAPAEAAVFSGSPVTVPLTAEATDGDGSVTRVEFYQNGTLLGTDTTAPYEWNWTNVPAGNYTLTAKAYDDEGAEATSEAVHIEVKTPLTGVALSPDAGNVLMAGQAQTWTAIPAGGVQPEYAFTVKLKDIKPDRSYTWVTLRSDAAYGASPICTFTAADPGAYTVAVNCRESGTATPVFTATVTTVIGTPTLTGVALAANMTSGVALSDIPAAGIRLTATPAGTGVGASYFFTGSLLDVAADGSSTSLPVTLSGDYGGPTFQWHPTEPGYYTLRVIARDATCNVSFNSYLTFLVRSGALKGLVFAANPISGTALNILPTGGITLSATPQGTGTGVEYFFSGIYKTKPDGAVVNTPVTLRPAWSTTRTFAWRPTEPGVYALTLTARDASYNTSIAKTMNYVLHLAKLTGIASLAADPPSGVAETTVPAGGITLTTTATPANASVEYFYAAKRRVYQPDGSYTDSPVTLSTAYQASPAFTWHPARPGMYLLTVTVRDTIFWISSRTTISYLIKPASLTGIADFTAAPASGAVDNAIPAGGITLTATPQGSGTGARYFFSAKLKDIAADGSYIMVPQTLSTAWSASPTFAWRPAAPGVYTLTVTAKDADGVVTFSRNLAYTLKSATVTWVTSFTPNVPSGTALASLPPGGVVFTAAIAGTGTGVLYRYQAGKYNGSAYVYDPLTDYTPAKTFTFAPASAGTYRVWVYAYDGTYNTSYYKYTDFVVR